MYVNISYKDDLFTYKISPAMLVHNLKEEISAKQNLYHFHLMLDQTKLLDQRPLANYLFTIFTLCYNDKEAVVEMNDFTLGVAVVQPENQNFFTVKATTEMTVGQLKERISIKLNSTQGKLILKKDGKVVPDGDLLKAHFDVKTFTVKLEDMDVIINYDGSFSSITKRSSTTIIDFKSNLASKVGKRLDEFDSFLFGEILDLHAESDSIDVMVVDDQFIIDIPKIM